MIFWKSGAIQVTYKKIKLREAILGSDRKQFVNAEPSYYTIIYKIGNYIIHFFVELLLILNYTMMLLNVIKDDFKVYRV